MSNLLQGNRNRPRNQPFPIAGFADPFASPPFRKLISTFWKDVVILAGMGALALGLHLAPPIPSRTFPITFKDGEIVLPQFAYDPRRQILPIWATVLLSGGVPILVFGLAQIRVRSFWDFFAASLGVAEALVTSAVFQVSIKWLIGGLRPHFLAACNPEIPYRFF